ncbi:MAG: sigma-54-dependent Fis family transcriptional regulator [Nitrospinae bacterium]|nr:sigma-54-dependent Fis family transcriptional regulator [Nitrospinota bacterium]
METVCAEPIVIIDDDKAICRTLQLHFEREGVEIVTAHYAHEGLEKLKKFDSAIVILDLRLPDADGVDILKKICDMGKSYYTIIITAFPNMESTVQAVQCGVGDYIHKPIDINELESAVRNAREFLTVKDEGRDANIAVPPVSSRKNLLMGKSQIMKEVFKMVGMVSLSKSTVLITGESGTGKELVARAIHESSYNASSPFISVNCSTIVDNLLESELFGHVKGSFTGAINTKEGKFTLAKDGTLFLDEIAEMSVNLQAKLLRVLQEREFEMVGGKTKLKADCRILSATNKNLEQMVKDGEFREELYYRIKVISIQLPPLKDRAEDIPDLVLFFVAKKAMEVGRNIRYVSQEAINHLAAQRWDGNIRQLENVITHAVIMSRGDTLTMKNFIPLLKKQELIESKPHSSAHASGHDAPFSASREGYKPASLNEVEKDQIYKTLAYTKWHKGKTCDILGITRPRLDRKIKKYGILTSSNHFRDN